MITFVTVLSILLGAAPYATGQSLDYTLGPGDLIGITLRERPDLSGKYVVQGDGTFAFPLVGPIKASGLTLNELQAELTRRLADGYFKSPQLSLDIEDYRSQRIFVIGEIARPGEYSLKGTMSLLHALAMSGPVGGGASDEVVIVRPHAERQGTGPILLQDAKPDEVIRVDLDRLQSGVRPQSFVLRSGDTVVVPKAESVYVFGEVRSPGAYPVKKTTTVLQALALAGGTGERGSTNRIRVIRLVNGTKKEVRVELDDIVKPNDTIIVPERWF